MNVFFVIGAGLLLLSVLLVVALLALTVVRALAVGKRVRALADHKAFAVVRSASNLGLDVPDLNARVNLVRGRVRAIGRSVALLLASSALLRSDVDRIARTTLTMLHVFVPGERRSS